MSHKLKGSTLLVEIAIIICCIVLIVLGSNIFVDSMKKSDKSDDIGHKYIIYITIADHEYYYYTDSFKVINNGNAIKFTDKTTEKTYIASQYFIEFD